MPFHICPIEIMAIVSIIPFVGVFVCKFSKCLHRIFPHKH